MEGKKSNFFFQMVADDAEDDGTGSRSTRRSSGSGGVKTAKKSDGSDGLDGARHRVRMGEKLLNKKMAELTDVLGPGMIMYNSFQATLKAKQNNLQNEVMNAVKREVHTGIKDVTQEKKLDFLPSIFKWFFFKITT